MIVMNKRCKHCHTMYAYYASGDGCLDPYNSPDYCPECMKAIKDALAAIPVKYKGVYTEIEFNQDIYDKMQKIKENYLKDTVFTLTSINDSKLPFNDIDMYVIDNVKYAFVNDNHTMYILNEYDMVNKTFTGYMYQEYNGPEHDSFHKDRQMPVFKGDLETIKFEKPKGNLFYVDYFGNDDNVDLIKKAAFELAVEQAVSDPDLTDMNEIERHVKVVESLSNSYKKSFDSFNKIGESLSETLKDKKDLPEGKIYYFDSIKDKDNGKD